jgi:hypothetical protein
MLQQQNKHNIKMGIRLNSTAAHCALAVLSRHPGCRHC